VPVNKYALTDFIVPDDVGSRAKRSQNRHYWVFDEGDLCLAFGAFSITVVVGN